jgi:hypothetical protein
MSGPPIQVSATERDRFIANFDKFVRWSKWLIVAGTVLLMVSVVSYSVSTNTPVSNIAIYGGLGVLLPAYLGAYYWARNLPSRELRGRAVIGEPRSRVEMQRLLLGKISYARLAGTAAIAALFAIRAGWYDHFQSMWDRGWIVFAVVTIALSGWQALRKWRLGSASK